MPNLDMKAENTENKTERFQRDSDQKIDTDIEFCEIHLMARRAVVTQVKIQKSLLSRPLNSAITAITATGDSSPPLHLTTTQNDQQPINETPSTKTRRNLDFTNTKALFGSLSTTSLLRASANLHVSAMGAVVDVGTWVMNSKMMEVELIRELILGIVKNTFYEHFCAGEDEAAVKKTVGKLKEVGLRSMLDYALEYVEGNEACDQNLQTFLKTVESTKSLPPASASFVVTKISAICPLKLMERVSDLLRWQEKEPSLNLPWKLKTFPIFSESSPLYHTLKKPHPLTKEEEEDLKLSHDRLFKICEKCIEANIPLAIDAEHTRVQPAIDYFTYSSAIIYNKKHDNDNDNPLVFGTIQAYLKDAKDRLILITDAAEKTRVPIGVKLVRGAYMSSETKLASSLGFQSPIHDSIQNTHSCYNNCASYLLDVIARGSGAAILATHNVESGELAIAKANELRLNGDQKKKLEFAQLYGMSDGLSFGLRNAGFQVSKYMPFGPVDMVIPYLLRRAEENRGLLATSNLDRQLIRKELFRRLKENLR